MKHVLIIGNSPLRQTVREQYSALGAEMITECDHDSSEPVWPTDVDEIVVFSSSKTESAIVADNKAIDTLSRMAYAQAFADKRRPVVHLQLQSATSLWMLQTMDLPEEVNETFDVYPFTIEDVWAKNVLVQLPGIKNAEYPILDRTSIGRDSRCFVHIVLSGFNSQAEAVAIHAALTAHFPNYRADDTPPLRTRITIVDDGILAKRDIFVAKYQHLFDNSFYRTVDPNCRTVHFHRPMYDGKRTDFVDVEWEFVDGAISHREVYKKMEIWANKEEHQLTVFVCHDDDEQNLAESMALPRVIYEKGIPVMVQQKHKGLTDALKRSSAYGNIHPFGMHDSGYDVALPMVRLAKYLKYFYDCSYGNVGVPTELPYEEVERGWHEEKSFKMRFSNIYNVMTIATKMRSLGHDADDAGTFYALTQEEIETMAETEHNRWSVERLIMGARPCTDAELDDIRTDIKAKKKAYKKRDIHFDLRAYSELEEDGTGKNARVYDYDLTACIPLIVKCYNEDISHGE